MDQHLRRDDAAGFLASLAVADRAALVELGRSVSVPAGRSLFLAGSVPDAVYVVRSGRIRLSRSDSDGATLALGLRTAGDVLGLAELLRGHPKVAVEVLGRALRIREAAKTGGQDAAILRRVTTTIDWRVRG